MLVTNLHISRLNIITTIMCTIFWLCFSVSHYKLVLSNANAHVILKFCSFSPLTLDIKGGLKNDTANGAFCVSPIQTSRSVLLTT
jgi:hypothetical protein